MVGTRWGVAGVPYPLKPMVAVNAGVLPDDGRWAYEPKFDGFLN